MRKTRYQAIKFPNTCRTNKQYLDASPHLDKEANSRPHEWFAKELSVCNSGSMKKLLGHKYKVKENCFYGKIIEDFEKYASTKFNVNEKQTQMEDIGNSHAYEIRKWKRNMNMDRAYQVGTAVYPLVKLSMLDFYYNIINRYVHWCDYNLKQVDTNSLYMTLLGNLSDNLVNPEVK